jgi:hypothetical protein
MLLSRIRYRFHRYNFLRISLDPILEPILVTDYYYLVKWHQTDDRCSRFSRTISIYQRNDLIGLSCKLMYLLFILLMMNCLLDMRCLAPKESCIYPTIRFGLFKEAKCLEVLVHLEIFLLCFSLCNIIENVVGKKKICSMNEYLTQSINVVSAPPLQSASYSVPLQLYELSSPCAIHSLFFCVCVVCCGWVCVMLCGRFLD